jgi:hypothetical protein
MESTEFKRLDKRTGEEKERRNYENEDNNNNDHATVRGSTNLYEQQHSRGKE